MHRHLKHGLMALVVATVVWGCAGSMPSEDTADAQRDALVQRTQAYQRDARQAPDRLSPERKADLQQLATDVRTWQAWTGRDDIMVSNRRQATARRANNGGGSENCANDCPVYTFKNDEICFLQGSECSSDPESHGTICIYSCISIRSDIASALKQAP